jgi:hypothetical protein
MARSRQSRASRHSWLNLDARAVTHARNGRRGGWRSEAPMREVPPTGSACHDPCAAGAYRARKALTFATRPGLAMRSRPKPQVKVRG